MCREHVTFTFVSSLPHKFTNANGWRRRESQRKQPLFTHLPNVLDPQCQLVLLFFSKAIHGAQEVDKEWTQDQSVSSRGLQKSDAWKCLAQRLSYSLNDHRQQYFEEGEVKHSSPTDSFGPGLTFLISSIQVLYRHQEIRTGTDLGTARLGHTC